MTTKIINVPKPYQTRDEAHASAITTVDPMFAQWHAVERARALGLPHAAVVVLR